jgi:5-methylcytosine-specific restriction enzyme B
MSRYCGDVDPSVILAAAAHWRDTALIGDGSVFTEKKLWTEQSLAALDQHYVQRPDEGEGTFHEKLQQQLAPAGAEAIQLAAELMWLLYLCPRTIKAPRKRHTLQTIWGWSGEVFPAESQYLTDEVLGGIGSAGPGFNQNQWRELVFAINLAREFKRLGPDAGRSLLAKPWEFDQWISALPDADARQSRHMILFLLFPDVFERVFGQTDRKAISVHFSGIPSREAARMSNFQIDKVLHDMRSALEKRYGRTDLDFYVPPLRDEWKMASLSEATEGLTKEHILTALAQIDSQGVPSDARSMTYDLQHNGKAYPPKYVLSLAVGAATGEPFDRSMFTGGAESTCFKILRDRGFEIIKREQDADLGRQLTSFLKQARESSDLKTQSYEKEYRGLRVRVSFGQGAFARVPWMAWLGGEERVSNGIYPVLLFFRAEGKLLLCYGVSETERPQKQWAGIPDTETVRDWFLANVGHEPARYGDSLVAVAFDDKDLDISVLQKRIDGAVDLYLQNLDAESSSARVNDVQSIPDEVDDLPAKANLQEAAEAFSDALLEAGVTFGERHSLMVSAFVASLMTKPLVILTGLSGSGKSQIAVRFGEWIGADRVHVAAVRPDWTGSDSLFGYEDGLKPISKGVAAWNVPDTLSFMLRAHHDPQHPYLLVLDEMNLAHVERYFADVLSGMESGQPCIPNLQRSEEDGCWRPRAKAEARIPFPRNLWIVGTVNVDETTYMFSPKVLDRASTLEFRVHTSDLTVNPKKPTSCNAGNRELIRGLQQIARDDAWHVTHPFSQQADFIKTLHRLHRALSEYGLEFGHRVFYEAVRFAAMAEQAGVHGLERVLDLVVLQKVLPRLHGSRRRLEGPLKALLAFCDDPSVDAAASEPSASAAASAAPRLPLSYSKLQRMQNSLRANQFVSFAE